jgi:hypothetical protein
MLVISFALRTVGSALQLAWLALLCCATLAIS